jgi:hypothetical protein
MGRVADHLLDGGTTLTRLALDLPDGLRAARPASLALRFRLSPATWRARRSPGASPLHDLRVARRRRALNFSRMACRFGFAPNARSGLALESAHETFCCLTRNALDAQTLPPVVYLADWQHRRLPAARITALT